MNGEFIEQLKGKRILFATMPADGHFNPLTGLAKFLQQIGCDVRWYVSGFYGYKLKKLNILHYPVLQAVDMNVGNVDELYPERKLIADVGEKANFDMIMFGKLATGYFEDISAIRERFLFDIMIADSLFTAIPLVKAKLGIPVIAIGVIPLAEESIDTAPYGPGLPPPSTIEERIQYSSVWDGLVNVSFKESIDLYGSILADNNIQFKRSYLFDILIRQADLYLQIGSPSLEYARTDLGNNIRYIGALLPYVPATDAPQWFDERLKTFKKIVLVTQGTVEKDISKLLVPTLEAFSDTDTLVIATTGGNDTDILRKKYPAANLIIEDFIPFNAVMPYATVYVTNGGYGGTLLAISHKLPMVAAGLHEGKSEVCARIGYFSYGIDLHTETPTPLAIKEAVDKIAAEPAYRQNISRLAEELNAHDANELCGGYIAELIVKKPKRIIHSAINESVLQD